MWTNTSFCWELIVLPSLFVWSLDTYFNLSPIYHLYVLSVKIAYQTRFCLQISYPAILFTMGFLNPGSFIVHALRPGTNKQTNSHCQFSCRVYIFTSFCRAQNDMVLLYFILYIFLISVWYFSGTSGIAADPSQSPDRARWTARLYTYVSSTGHPAPPSLQEQSLLTSSPPTRHQVPTSIHHTSSRMAEETEICQETV